MLVMMRTRRAAQGRNTASMPASSNRSKPASGSRNLPACASAIVLAAALEAEVVQVAAFSELDRWFDPIPREPRSGTDWIVFIEGESEMQTDPASRS